MDKKVEEKQAPAAAAKKNEKLTGWLGFYVGMTAVGAAWTIINLFRNNFDVLGDCGGKAGLVLRAFCKDVTPPIIAEIIVGFILAALAVVAVILVSKRKKISIPYVIAFEAVVLTWNIIDFAIASAVLGPWAEKTHINVSARLIVSLIFAIVQAGWIPYFIFSKAAKKELNQ